MKINKLFARTTRETGYINGHHLHSDLTELLFKLIGPNKHAVIRISPTYIAGYTKATKNHKVGNRLNAQQYDSKEGSFSVCRPYVATYELHDEFYYQVIK